jgi:hypothetical protein
VLLLLPQSQKVPRLAINKTTQQLKELVVHGLLVPGPEALQVDIMVRTRASLPRGRVCVCVCVCVCVWCVCVCGWVGVGVVVVRSTHRLFASTPRLALFLNTHNRASLGPSDFTLEWMRGV